MILQKYMLRFAPWIDCEDNDAHHVHNYLSDLSLAETRQQIVLQDQKCPLKSSSHQRGFDSPADLFPAQEQ